MPRSHQIVPISEATKQFVRERANFLCEYCHSLEILSANRLTIDHIVPRSLGGSDDEDDSIRQTRRFWTRTGLHPPSTDPQG